jgi:hypothetical protein
VSFSVLPTAGHANYSTRRCDNQDGRYNLQRKIVEAEQFSRNLSRKMKARSLEAVKWSLAACRPYRVYQC